MAFGVLIAVTYVNIVKNVETFSEGMKSAWIRTLQDGSTAPALWKVPYLGHWPGMDWVALTPLGWFNLTWGLMALLFIGLARAHRRRSLALVPASWLGAGQLAFLTLLWVMIVANWERAIPGFHPSRLLTEWGVFFNALLVTWAVLVWPPQREIEIAADPEWNAMARRVRRRAVAASIGGVLLFFALTRLVYSDYFAGHAKLHLRFGENASWRIAPILRQAPHR
jgi:hypothetical protein